jgi:hypothetical protein
MAWAAWKVSGRGYHFPGLPAPPTDDFHHRRDPIVSRDFPGEVHPEDPSGKEIRHRSIFGTVKRILNLLNHEQGRWRIDLDELLPTRLMTFPDS